MTSFLLFAILQEQFFEIQRETEMRKTTLSVLMLALTFVAIPSFAQAQTTVPDVSGPNWNLIGEERVDLAQVFDGKHTVTTFVAVAKTYNNDKDGLMASVLTWDGTEVAIAFGKATNSNSAAFALKVGGKWYLAKNGDKPPVISVVPGPNGTPTGIKLTLDTVDGPKELTLKIS